VDKRPGMKFRSAFKSKFKTCHFDKLLRAGSEPSRRIQNRNLVGIVALVVAFTRCGVVALAQEPKKVFRIGYLSNTDLARESARAEAIRLALRERGYIEGQNVETDYRYAEQKLDRLPELAAELVRLKVDVIVAAGGTVTVRAAMNATKAIPIVMTGSGIDPVKAGIVDTLARPGGNVTGLTNLVTDLGGKRLELPKETVPKLVRVAILSDPATPSNEVELNEVLPVAASALRLTVKSWEVKDASAIERVFAALGKERQDGLYILTSALLGANRKRTAGLALKSRLPSIYTNREGAEAGGLMSYGADQADIYRRVAYYVDRILKGAKPADLPVEQPMKFELVINLKTAKQIGVTIPPDVLARATKIIR
jgi:putative ABC transport system substrate-binding protein